MSDDESKDESTDDSGQQSDQEPADSDQPSAQSDDAPADSDQPAEGAEEQPAEQADQSEQQPEEQPTDSDQPAEQTEDKPADSDQPVEQAEEQPSDSEQSSGQSEEPSADSDQPSDQAEEQPADSDQPAASASADNTLAFAGGAASPGGGGPGVQARPNRTADLPDVIKRIAVFRTNTSVSPWNNLPRADVADRLLDIVQNPDDINQGADSLCGPAVFFNTWATDDPKAFAGFTFQLYNSGGVAPIGSLHIKAGQRLLHQDYRKVLNQIRTNPKFNGVVVPSTDWMVMSTIRDSENSVFVVYDGTPAATWEGGTTSDEVASWLRATGLYSSVKQVSTRTLAAAKNFNPTNNRRIILEIDDGMIPRGTHAGEANHFLSMRSKITEANGMITFDYWTWGQGVLTTPPMSQADFERDFYSAIIAEF